MIDWRRTYTVVHAERDAALAERDALRAELAQVRTALWEIAHRGNAPEHAHANWITARNAYRALSAARPTP